MLELVPKVMGIAFAEFLRRGVSIGCRQVLARIRWLFGIDARTIGGEGTQRLPDG